MDSSGRKAGKGPLIQTEVSATLGTAQDQYLFQAVGIDFYNQTLTNDKSKCLTNKATDSDHIPCVMVREKAFGFDSYNQELHDDVAATLKTNGGGDSLPKTVVRAYDIGEARLRTPNEYEDLSPTLTARCGTGGNNTPAVVYDARGNGDGITVNTLTGDHENRITDYTSIVCLEGNGTRPSHEGNGYAESDVMYTLNSTERHAVSETDRRTTEG